jgi:hypothetical protein
VSDKPILFSGEMVKAILEGRKTQTRRIVKFNNQLQPNDHNVWLSSNGWQDCDFPIKCPYGEVGNRLWVRETWATLIPLFEGADYSLDERREAIIYRANGQPELEGEEADRITLEVTGVKVKRLQDISEADTKAEGFELGSEYWYDNFKKTWVAINGAGSWGSNPWVWVVEFKRVEGGSR